MSAINAFLLANHLRIDTNPAVSPDWCLDWPAMQVRLKREAQPHATLTLRRHEAARFATAHGSWVLAEDEYGDHAWILDGVGRPAAELLRLLDDGVALQGSRVAFPATWVNLLKLKNHILAHDPQSTIFPVARGTLAHTSIGVGARFTEF